MERQTLRRSAPVLAAISAAMNKYIGPEWFAAQAESDEIGRAMFEHHQANSVSIDPGGEF